MGYSSYFGLEVADYGMTSGEMMALMDEPGREHAAALRRNSTPGRATSWRRATASRCRAHPRALARQPLGPGLARLVEGIDLDALVRRPQPEWLIGQAERFYVSHGLAASAGRRSGARSDLYALPADATRKKEHARLGLAHRPRPGRALADERRGRTSHWFSTTHHELGHVYYYLSYSRPEVPPCCATAPTAPSTRASAR